MLPPDIVLSEEEARELTTTDLAVAGNDAVFRVEGPGTVDCLQGLLTNDVVKPGSPSLIWGAFLTPKGMIVSDAWIRRDDQGAWVVVPGIARERVHDLLRRSLPPRLARPVDRSGMLAVRRLLGRSSAVPGGNAFAHPSGPAPFTALLLSEDPAVDDARLAAAGWRFAPPRFVDAVRVALGWPALDLEIDERTLPQEVRFDELQAVKYDKGCFTGQETVARVHFRGHVNRTLRGLTWEDGPPADREVLHEGRVVGTVRTVMHVGTRRLALSVLRREVADGETVMAGGAPARVVALPFDLAVHRPG
jgi:folate-binding protein YgfZ